MKRHIPSRDLRRKLIGISARRQPPEGETLEAVLLRAHELLTAEPEEYRPRDGDGLSGGLIDLSPDRVTVIVPDVHARANLVLNVLDYRVPQDGDGNAVRLLDLLHSGQAQLVFLGDYVHGEARVADRWRKAFEEFSRGYRHHEHMSEEMRESLGTVEMLLELKLALPGTVHMLKGNHENILNERGRGNFPFRKFAQEGMMVADYMARFYGEVLMRLFAEVEHSLPLLAEGERLLIAHAEPKTLYSKERIINYRRNDDVVTGLTWTANDGADPHAVTRMLDYYIDPAVRKGALQFGGHRPIKGRYNLRADGEYVQIHNPEAQAAAFVPPGVHPDPERHIIHIGADEEPNDAIAT